jgi:hypothetical protein
MPTAIPTATPTATPTTTSTATTTSADKKARKDLKNAKIQTKSVSIGMEHAHDILVNQPLGQPPISWNTIVNTETTCLPPSSASNPMADRVKGANSVLPQVIVTTALLALVRQVKEAEQRNPRKGSTVCHSTKKTATKVVGNQYNGEQIAKSRKCNLLQSKVSPSS